MVLVNTYVSAAKIAFSSELGGLKASVWCARIGINGADTCIKVLKLKDQVNHHNLNH